MTYSDSGSAPTCMRSQSRAELEVAVVWPELDTVILRLARGPRQLSTVARKWVSSSCHNITR